MNGWIALARCLGSGGGPEALHFPSHDLGNQFAAYLVSRAAAALEDGEAVVRAFNDVQVGGASVMGEGVP
jgi:hypothetical protein